MSYYGMDEISIYHVKRKLQRQDDFLNNNGIKDNLNGNIIPLKKIVFSTYHNPQRYYSEIQNRVNTLVQYAEGKNLKPLFMTLTLPSKYHRLRMIKNGIFKDNPKYEDFTPTEAKKELTKMFARLRQDRSLKELSKDERVYFRITEPHKDGTPHSHILLFVPSDRIDKVIEAFNRLFCKNKKINDIQKITADIKNSVAYIMKYINKTLPLSKKDNLSQKEECLHYWYNAHRITRFNSSNSLAPICIYRKTFDKLSLRALTKIYRDNELEISEDIDNKTILEIKDKITGVLYYQKNINAYLHDMATDRKAFNKKAFDSFNKRLIVVT
jgi:hypothetical protein